MNCCRRALWSCWLLVAAGCVPVALPRSGTATVVDQHGRPAAGVRLTAEPSIGYLGLNTGAGPASLGSPFPVANHTSHGDLQDLVTDELGVAHTQRGMANAVTWRVMSSGEYLSVGIPWVLNSSRISSDSMNAQLVAWRLPAGETEPFMLAREESTTLLPDQAWLPVWLVSGTGILSDEAPGSGPDLVVRGTQVGSLTAPEHCSS